MKRGREVEMWQWSLVHTEKTFILASTGLLSYCLLFLLIGVHSSSRLESLQFIFLTASGPAILNHRSVLSFFFFFSSKRTLNVSPYSQSTFSSWDGFNLLDNSRSYSLLLCSLCSGGTQPLTQASKVLCSHCPLSTMKNVCASWFNLRQNLCENICNPIKQTSFFKSSQHFTYTSIKTFFPLRFYI